MLIPQGKSENSNVFTLRLKVSGDAAQKIKSQIKVQVLEN